MGVPKNEDWIIVAHSVLSEAALSPPSIVQAQVNAVFQEPAVVQVFGGMDPGWAKFLATSAHVFFCGHFEVVHVKFRCSKTKRRVCVCLYFPREVMCFEVCVMCYVWFFLDFWKYFLCVCTMPYAKQTSPVDDNWQLCELVANTQLSMWLQQVCSMVLITVILLCLPLPVTPPTKLVTMLNSSSIALPEKVSPPWSCSSPWEVVRLSEPAHFTCCEVH